MTRKERCEAAVAALAEPTTLTAMAEAVETAMLDADPNHQIDYCMAKMRLLNALLDAEEAGTVTLVRPAWEPTDLTATPV